MRRDSIFYALFQQSPMLLFELLEEAPLNAQQYRFDSVAVKEPRFEIDGVFLPPDTGIPGIVYFCEVQFQRDERLYERLFGESFLYFYRNRDRYSDWQAVVIYPSRKLEQSEIEPYRALLESDKVHRIFLDELGEFDQLPLEVALVVLTTLEEAQATEAARLLLARSRQASVEPAASRAIIEMLTTIMVYKFTNLSRREIEAMLDITLQQTRVYQEAKEEEARSLILRQLVRRVGELSDSVRSKIETLSLSQLEALAEALLDFGAIADLEAWLQENG
jgi:predicted transposase/invertase (TIGR01784 family)